jgi:serine protein kinase
MMKNSTLQSVHIAPLTLKVASIFTVLSRLEPPEKQGMSLTDKQRLYDGEMVLPYSKADLQEIQRHHPNEGMQGVSPRYVMNRLDAVVGGQRVTCISPLAALASLWEGLGENVSLDQKDAAKFVGLVVDTVKEYGELAVQALQRAFEENFEEKAKSLLDDYLSNVVAFSTGEASAVGFEAGADFNERDMREIEKVIKVNERDKREFRHEINHLVSLWKDKGLRFKYTSEPRLRTAIEAQLYPPRRQVERGLTEPRLGRQKAEWKLRKAAIASRLMESYDYCTECAHDVIGFAAHVLKNNAALKTPKNEGVEWLWPLNPGPPETDGAE